MTYASEAGKFSIALGGDCMLTRPITMFDEPAFLAVANTFRESDVGFVNLETVVRRWDEGTPGITRGTYMTTAPELLEGPQVVRRQHGVHRQQPCLRLWRSRPAGDHGPSRRRRHRPCRAPERISPKRACPAISRPRPAAWRWSPPPRPTGRGTAPARSAPTCAAGPGSIRFRSPTPIPSTARPSTRSSA